MTTAAARRGAARTEHRPRRRPVAWVVPAVTVLALLAGCSPGGPDTADPTTTRAEDVAGESADGPTTDADAPSSGEDVASDAEGRAAPVPVARTEVAGTAWRGTVVVLGGWPAGAPASDAVHAWDPTTDAWTPLPPLPRAVHHTAVVAHDDALWVLGGYEPTDEQPTVPTRNVWVLTDPSEEWLAGPALPEPRGALAAAVAADGLVVGGGVGPDGATASTWVLRGDRWVAGPDLPAAVEHHAAAPTPDGRVLVVGGRDGGIDTSRSSTTLLDVGAGTSTPGPVMTARRSGVGAALVDDRVCVAGGELPEGTVAPVECLDPGGGSWSVVDDLDVPRHGLAVVALAGRLPVVAGGPEPGLTHSRVHEVVTP